MNHINSKIGSKYGFKEGGCSSKFEFIFRKKLRFLVLLVLNFRTCIIKIHIINQLNDLIFLRHLKQELNTIYWAIRSH